MDYKWSFWSAKGCLLTIGVRFRAFIYGWRFVLVVTCLMKWRMSDVKSSSSVETPIVAADKLRRAIVNRAHHVDSRR